MALNLGSIDGNIGWLCHHFGSGGNFSATISLINMKFCKDIHDPRNRNSTPLVISLFFFQHHQQVHISGFELNVSTHIG